MLLWEFILTSDNALDLSDGERMVTWLKTTGYLPQFTMGRGGEPCDPPPGFWAEAHVEFFREKLLALRSLGKRLKGFKSREPRGDDLNADAELMQYVRYICHKVVQKGRPGPRDHPRPLDRGNYDGLRPCTERPDDVEEWLVGRWQGLDVHQQFVLLELDKFFASAFLSMVTEGIMPICGRCGRELESTPTGRKPRAKFCKDCAFAAWLDTKSPEQKRKRWREEKQRQREEAKQPKRRK